MADSQAPRSSIWYHFTKGVKKGKCRYCQKDVAITQGTTSNLRRHLQKIHPTVIIEQNRHRDAETRSRSPPPREVTKGSLEDSFDQTDEPTSGPSSSTQNFTQPTIHNFANVLRPLSIKRSREIDIQLLKVICMEYQPFSIVENPEFQKFISLLNPNYKLPGRKTLSCSLLPALYSELFEKTTRMLENTSAVCITCDGWTNINTTAFYGLTAHFFDSEFNLQSALLECSEFTERHTSQNIANWVRDTLKKFKIDYKICAMVTDNASNMKAAAGILNFRHIPCFAHSLNLAVQSAIANSIKKTVDKVKSAVQFFKQSAQATQKLAEMQKTFNLKVLKLKQDVPTRWNSTFIMLQRVLERKEPLISVLALMNSAISFSEEDWQIVKQAVDVLQVFFEVTEEVSSSKTLTMSKTCILARGMRKRVANWLSDKTLSPDVSRLCEVLSEELTKRFGGRETQELIAQSVFLDPRFKKHGFGDVARFQQAFNSIVKKVKIAVSTSKKDNCEDFPENASEEERTPCSSIWEEFEAAVQERENVNDPEALAIVEVDKYIAEPLLKRSFDPIQWWGERRHVFPHLFEIAQKRLCIPATSVPCERLFSKAGQLYTEKRSRLTTSKVAEMLFINSNSRLFQ